MSEVYGAKVEAQRRLSFLNLGSFTANATKTIAEFFGCPPGIKGIRVVGVHVAGDAIPSDPDGTMLFNAIVNDISEGADDTIVSSEDLETLMVAANRWYECTLAAEDAEKQLTLEPGDSVRFTLVNNSAAITTNPNVTVCVEWHPVPDYDDLDRVQHPSEYEA
jgi:hypothetical protein